MKLRLRIGRSSTYFRVEFDRDVGAVGLELLDFAADFYGLRNVANAERGVSVSAGIGGNLDVLDFKYFEATGFDTDIVKIGNQVRYGVVAAVIGRCFFDRAFGNVGHRDLRADDASALRISDGYRRRCRIPLEQPLAERANPLLRTKPAIPPKQIASPSLLLAERNGTSPITG